MSCWHCFGGVRVVDGSLGYVTRGVRRYGGCLFALSVYLAYWKRILNLWPSHTRSLVKLLQIYVT